MKIFPSILGLMVMGSLLLATPSEGTAQNTTKTVPYKHLSKAESIKMHEEYPKVAQVGFKSVKTQEERFEIIDKEWHDLWHSFIEYYHAKGLKEKGRKKLYVHLHFGDNGNLDYFRYHWVGKQNQFTDAFIEHFKEFVKTYKFNLNEGVKFSQCGMLHIVPKVGVKEGA